MASRDTTLEILARESSMETIIATILLLQISLSVSDATGEFRKREHETNEKEQNS
jgi:hypothetical protein